MSDLVPPIPPHHKRSWRKCNACGHVGFRDYLPFSLQNPILVMPCGHSGHRDSTTELSEEQGLALVRKHSSARKVG